MKNKILSLPLLALAVGLICIQAATAQSFKRVPVKGSVPIVQIAAGDSSVWALASNGHPYVYKGGQFAMAKNLVLTQIAAGGGSLTQPDAVWGISAAGNVYSATLTGTKWVFSLMPGVLDFIAVGIGYADDCHPYEVWGLNTAAFIYRYNYCLQNWEQAPGTLGTIAVGGGEVWGIGGGLPFVFNFSTLSFDPPPDASNRSYVDITVGPFGAWAKRSFTGDPDVYLYDKLLFEFSPEGDYLDQIKAGGNGVWGLGSAHSSIFISHFEPSTLKFVEISREKLTSISVGNSGVWGINGSHEVYSFSTP
ncbi:MAG: hypothetical protein HY010_10025 [Acidobacteria bacterium]|nr:hypothetical protein [Acidobacteriota bacterium]